MKDMATVVILGAVESKRRKGSIVFKRPSVTSVISCVNFTRIFCDVIEL